MIQNPCYQCQNRTMRCHIDYVKYKEFMEERKQKAAAVLSSREKYNISAKYEIDRADKIRKRGK